MQPMIKLGPSMCMILKTLSGAGGGAMGEQVSRQSWQEQGVESLVMPFEHGTMVALSGVIA